MSPFTSPPDPAAFNQRVWDIVRHIPSGRVATYGQISQMIWPPDSVDAQTYRSLAPRWVGSAMANCPNDIPWQRVINSKGEISPRPGASEQRRLLEAEGVVFNERGRVDLARFGWKPGGAGGEQDSLFAE
jgi:methylated-DNA-protein-cysteine methyltransferase related protein